VRYVKPMLQTCSRIIALTAMVAGPSMTAQAADSTLTLACQGTATSRTMEDAKPEPVSMGIILNFTKNTVQGFGYLLGYPPGRIACKQPRRRLTSSSAGRR
jgi:hypothetical protein